MKYTAKFDQFKVIETARKSGESLYELAAVISSGRDRSGYDFWMRESFTSPKHAAAFIRSTFGRTCKIGLYWADGTFRARVQGKK
jgi:hypothetical protein